MTRTFRPSSATTSTCAERIDGRRSRGHRPRLRSAAKRGRSSRPSIRARHHRHSAAPRPRLFLQYPLPCFSRLAMPFADPVFLLRLGHGLGKRVRQCFHRPSGDRPRYLRTHCSSLHQPFHVFGLQCVGVCRVPSGVRPTVCTVQGSPDPLGPLDDGRSNLNRFLVLVYGNRSGGSGVACAHRVWGQFLGLANLGWNNLACFFK